MEVEKNMIVYFIYCQECVDCRNMKKIVLKTLQSLNVEFEFNEFDCETDEAVDIAIEYNVSSIPTFVFIKNGEVVGKETGYMDKETLKSKLESLLD